jgi:hypothetical protein
MMKSIFTVAVATTLGLGALAVSGTDASASHRGYYGLGYNYGPHRYYLFRGYSFGWPWRTFSYDRFYADGSYYENRGGFAHVDWCLNRYRSYSPRTNTWVSYNGRVHRCISPYS